MSQQGMEFEGVMRDSPKSSAPLGYEGVPHYKDYTANSYGQKVVTGHSNTASAGQRLALAIVSLSLLLIMFIVDVLIASNLPWYNNTAGYVTLAALVFMFGIFAVATIIVNYFFNRRN